MRRGRAIMIQGTSSHVGKTVLCTALCRVFRQDGLRVAPFKAQNMSNNAWVTRDGGEMARAQALQAEAAGVEPSVDMNPVLLKPRGETVSEVIVHGRPAGDAVARDFHGPWRDRAWAAACASLQRLLAEYDVVVIEGAGSPAEMNLRRRDMVNMRVAAFADAPVLLVGDVDRGGVFASLLGTLWLLPREERRRVAGLVVNKFRGDPELFREGVAYLEARARKPVLGVLPWIDVGLEEEDSLALSGPGGAPRADGHPDAGGALDIAAIHHPLVSNFTDLDPVRRAPGVRLRWVRSPGALGTPDAVILPGSKNTIRDLLFLHRSGLDRAIMAAAERGIPVVGICGGYQMMGRLLLDPEGREGAAGAEAFPREVPGLGLLPAVTVFGPEKRTRQARGRVVSRDGPFEAVCGREVAGYEIHTGVTRLEPGAQPLLRLDEPGPPAWDGCVARGGAVFGTYLHGLFENRSLLEAWLAWLRGRRRASAAAGPPGPAGPSREEAFDRLADWARRHLNMAAIYGAMGR